MLQSLLKTTDLLSKACNLVPQVVQTCHVCTPWKRPGQFNILIYSLAGILNEEVPFDLLFYRSALQPNLDNEKGIRINHLTDCSIM